MENINVATNRGTVLNGVLFPAKKSDTVVIAITGIHGNFYSNPFYFNIGDTLSDNGIDFIYAQTNDAFGQIETVNVKKPVRKKLSSCDFGRSFTRREQSYLLSFDTPR